MKDLTVTFLRPLEQSAYSSWWHPNKSWGHKGFGLVKRVACIPLAFGTTVADTTLGVVGATVALFTPKAVPFTQDHLSRAAQIFSRPYYDFVTTLNPSAHFRVQEYHSSGLTTGYVKEFFDELADEARESKRPFVSGFISRLTYALEAVACLITRTVDLVIGLIAAVFSLVSFGTVGFLNNAAAKGLQPLGIIYDLFACAIKIARPGTSI